MFWNFLKLKKQTEMELEQPMKDCVLNRLAGSCWFFPYNSLIPSSCTQLAFACVQCAWRHFCQFHESRHFSWSCTTSRLVKWWKLRNFQVPENRNFISRYVSYTSSNTLIISTGQIKNTGKCLFLSLLFLLF